jgi:hypothetical protein
MAVALTLPVADAGVISTVTAGEDVALGDYAYGQAVTTPAGGPWHSVVFAFLGARIDTGGGTFIAPPVLVPMGTLYMLSQEYGGAPADLGPLTPGFLGSANQLTAEGWAFDGSLAILPVTTYYFYSDSTLHGVGIHVFGGPGGYWTATGGPQCDGAVDCSFEPTYETNYQLTTAIPEPSMMWFLAAGMAVLGAWRRFC